MQIITETVTGVIADCKAAFPMQMNLSIITSVAQEPTKTCQAYLARLTVAFDLHIGMTGGQMGAAAHTAFHDPVEARNRCSSKMKMRLLENSQ